MSSSNFLIKHMSSGNYLCPKGMYKNPVNATPVVLHDGKDETMQWKFVPVKGYWGYIEHVKSGKIIHPTGGQLNPPDDVELIVYDEKHWGCLFAIDENRHLIIHTGGKCAQPKYASPGKSNDLNCVLAKDINMSMEFQFVSTDGKETIIPIYQTKPNVTGDWKIVNIVRNPLAEHKQTFQVKVGRTQRNTISHTFSVGIHASESVGFKKILEASVERSLDVKYMFEMASESVWQTEKTMSTEITVQPGRSVVTWQYCLSVNHNDEFAEFQTNILADTEDELTKPIPLASRNLKKI